MIKITERGWGGHFCGANSCHFRRNTLIEKESGERIVVSTVGNWLPRNETTPRQIGAGRYYETMAFKAQYQHPYWESDVEEELAFPLQWHLPECNRESDYHANAMHEAVVAFFSLEEEVKV
jgi:hypothetical protein